jgi:hypothetical protein
MEVIFMSKIVTDSRNGPAPGGLDQVIRASVGVE